MSIRLATLSTSPLSLFSASNIYLFHFKCKKCKKVWANQLRTDQLRISSWWTVDMLNPGDRPMTDIKNAIWILSNRKFYSYCTRFCHSLLCYWICYTKTFERSSLSHVWTGPKNLTCSWVWNIWLTKGRSSKWLPCSYLLFILCFLLCPFFYICELRRFI